MKRWHCAHCKGEPDWESYQSESFCRGCGARAVRMFEYGCTECDTGNALRFWAEEAPSHPCPQCGAPCYRVIEAPYVASSSAREQARFVDAAVEREVTREGASLTTLKRPLPRESGYTWGGMRGWVGDRINSVKPQTSVLPFKPGLRPRTEIVGVDNRKAV